LYVQLIVPLSPSSLLPACLPVRRAGSSSAAAGASATNPVYNLLPDCLSALLAMPVLREEQLTAVLGVLLGYVKVCLQLTQWGGDKSRGL
jgi:hypothetical protein